MSALTVGHPSADGHEWDDLVRLWEQTNAPEGCKVEILDRIITVAPPPDNNHNLIAHRVQRLLYRLIPEEWGVFQTLGTAVPSRSSLTIPDLAVAPEAVLESESGNYIPAAAAELVVEITSKNNAAHDRIRKAEIYAKAGVPLYLLIDRHAPAGPETTLYGHPKNDVYRVLHTIPFGGTLHLPTPFTADLDTKHFPLEPKR